MSQLVVVRLDPIDQIGRRRIADAAHRLKRWDGESWEVTQLPVPPKDKFHVRPETSECVDWLGFWIKTINDPHVRVVQ